MASRRVNLSSVSPSQKLADSLLHFVHEESLSFCETQSTQTNNVNNTLFDNNIIEDEQNSIQRDGPQLSDYLQLNGERLLWKGSLEMLKALMLELQEQGKWVCPGGESRRFKSTDKRFEMTCYIWQQAAIFNFSCEEGKEMKNKLKALASKRLHKGTKNSKVMPQEDWNKNIDNEPSTTNTNEDDCSGQVSSALDVLVSKLDNFEQQFKNFQAKTGNDIDIL